MENVIADKSYRFAVRITKLSKYLQQKKKEYTLSTQLLRSGTSIGANVAESHFAQSTADFISKLSIALKETGETDYWLRLLKDCDYLSDKEFSSIYTDCCEINKILSSIVKTAKENS